MPSNFGKIALGSLALGKVEAAQWAVIVAGSNGFYNYRHQADACHAYQVAKAGGIPEENIIMMAYDDVAHHEGNPFPGKLFNKPDPKGPGKDVYAGCKIDYKGKDVTPENFIAVLTGSHSVKKSLKSTQHDTVFVNFVDHGAPGLIAFPDVNVLHRDKLQKALKTMHQKQMYKKLVFYLEACESGSMFKGFDTPGIYALTAANAEESSWGTYCIKPIVNGKNIGSCLGDLFSVSWMEDEDSHNPATETLEAQFERVRRRTNKSHVLQFGDLSFKSDPVSEFLGSHTKGLFGIISPEVAESSVDSRLVDLRSTYEFYEGAPTSSERLVRAKVLHQELAKQEAVETTYRRIAELAYPDDTEQQMALRRRTEEPEQMECEVSAHQAIGKACADKFDANSGFALQFHQVIVNLCADVARGLKFAIAAAAEQACETSTSKAVVV